METMDRLVIINGSGGVGKDTLVDFCREEAERYGVEVYNISIIDPVKIALKYLEPDVSKDEAGRQFMADILDAWVKYGPGPIDRLLELSYQLRVSGSPCIIFIHIRQLDCIDLLLNMVGCSKAPDKLLDTKTVLVSSSRVRKFSNHADAGVAKRSYDYYIRNDGTLEELRDEAACLIDELMRLP